MKSIDLIQAKYKDDPWKLMVCCILLNQTTNQQVRSLIEKFFINYPDYNKIKEENLSHISALIKSTGFQNVKARRIIKMSQQFQTGFESPTELCGIGKYGLEVWEIFVNKNTEIKPTDKKLQIYLSSLVRNP